MILRPILALVIAVLIIVFVDQYARFTDRIRPEPLKFTEAPATGQYDLSIRSTCDLQGNAFGSPAIRVQFRDSVLVEENGSIPAGQVIRIDNVPDIKVGLNEFLVHVTPEEAGLAGSFSLEPQDDASNPIARAVRFEIFQDGAQVGDAVLWSQQAGPFSQLVRIDVRQGRVVNVQQ